VDVFKPECNRVKFVLSQFLNFEKFRRDRNTKLEEYDDQEEAVIEQRHELNQQHQELESQYNNLELQRQSREPQIRQLQQEVEVFATEIRKLNAEQAAIHETFRLLKQQVNEAQDKIAAQKFALITARQETDNLRSQIVQSPEKLKQDIQDLNRNVENEKNIYLEVEQHRLECESKVDSLTKVEKDIQKAIKRMGELEIEMVKCKQVIKNMKSDQTKLTEIETQMKELTTSELHLKRQLQTAQEKIVKLQKQQQDKKQEASQDILQRNQEHEVLLKQRFAIQQQIDENENNTKKIRRMMAYLENQHRSEIKLMYDKFGELSAKMRDYHQRVISKMSLQV